MIRPSDIPHVDRRWDEVSRLREGAEDYARKGDTLAAALLDTQASALAKRLREGEARDALPALQLLRERLDTAEATGRGVEEARRAYEAVRGRMVGDEVVA